MQDFSQALSKSRPALVTEVILPAAEEFSQSFLEELEQLQEDLTKQAERLDELKVARETNPGESTFRFKGGLADGNLMLINWSKKNIELFFLIQKDKDGEEAHDALDGVDAMTEATTIFRTDYSRYTQGVQQSGQSAMSSRSGRSSA